jgi:predicted class III extradiol MEMO1 family dioxygenase
MATIPLTLNLVEGSVALNFTPDAARNLQAHLSSLMNCLKAVATKATPGGRVAAQPPMEYQYTGDVFLEIFCNPNIWPSPFAAKVLITLRDDRIRLTTEAELSRLVEDVNQYLEQVG